MIIFPKITTTVIIGRDKSINAVEKAQKNNEPICVVAQKNTLEENINKNSIYKVGVLCNILQKLRLPDGTLKAVLEGIKCIKITNFIETNKEKDYFYVETESIRESKLKQNKEKIDQFTKIILNKFEEFVTKNKKIPADILPSLINLQSTEEICFYIATILPSSTAKKQSILEERNIYTKLEKIYELIEIELNLLNTEKQISENINKTIFKHQKKIYLNEQLKFIKKELGNDAKDEDSETEELKTKIKKLKLPKEILERCNKELKKLNNIFFGSPEATVIKNYLDWITSLPWNNKTKTKHNLKDAENILERDHYGLKEVKERILEFLAVYNKTQKLNGPIICLVGPPGVGKTSLAKSIAESLNRKYIKISLGGVKDEAEIRGHRKTYVGAMPGKIIQSLKKAKSSNPLILLDEVDKISSDYRGDPTSALLEVLDPEQNKHFNDHYLEVDYDLSDTIFLTTANNLSNIPIPFRDRMEIIRISGYTEDEKLEIAKRYLIPKQLKLHGLTTKEFSITDKSILEIIRSYTFEAGVRNLERELAKIIRKITKKIITKKIKSIQISTIANIKTYLGVTTFTYNKKNQQDLIGVTTGLAYTEFGGDLLSIEALKFNGTGKLNITGNLKEVMKESVQTAFSYVRSQASKLGIKDKDFNKYDFHVHVPEGATPKDGPSAGIAICGALMSAMTNKKVKHDIAMTGEITLTGRVLAIGGLKEKLLAALRGNIKTVIIPEENKKHLEELPKKITKELTIKTVKNAEQALELILKNTCNKKKK